MRAVLSPRPDTMELTEVDDPAPGPGEVLIDVVCSGVNRADLLQVAGHYPPPPGASDVLGLECSGHVAALGPGVAGLREGQPVCALLAGGGYAERVVAPAGQVAPVPEGVGLIEAGGLPEVTCTVWSNLVMTAGLTAGETVLVHGGSSGVGTMAIQVATALGARVVVTVGSEAKERVCRELGAHHVVRYRDEDFAEVLPEADLRPDVILDIVGAAYLAGNLAVLAPGGRLVVIGLLGGARAELDLGRLLARRASVTATSLRSRSTEEKTAIVDEVVEHVWPRIADGAIRPIVHTVLGADDVTHAHRVLQESDHIGKVLLRWSQPSERPG